ncbi:MAG: peroxidase-related enzyme [Candidatus Natronoplasma sp.]
MSWIDEIEVEKAEGELEEIYDTLKESRGKVSNILKVHSLNPRAMKAHLDLYMSVMFKDTSLSRKEGEMIAVVVSAANGCEYCVAHHSEALDHYWRDEERVKALAEDHNSLELSEKHDRMLNFAEKLTLDPDSMKEEDADVLRDVDFNDQDILNIALITGYFNFVNRIALGLGVEAEKGEVEGYEY